MSEETKKEEGATLHSLKNAMGADKVEAVDNEGRVLESTEEEATARLRDLVSGKVEPPNEFVAYLIQKMIQARTEYIAVASSIQETTTRLAQMKERVVSLQAENNKYLDDIKAWDRKLEGPTD